MRKLPVIGGLCLMACACSFSDRGFIEQPDQYGLYVAVTDIYMDIPVQVQNDATGEVISIQTHLYDLKDPHGYLVHSLKPGRYHLYSYNPYSNISLSLKSSTGYFDVRAGCFNYGGHIDFKDVHGYAAYTNEVDLADVSQLPKSIAEVAKGKDLCMAPLGEPNRHFTQDAVRGLFHEQ